MRLLAVVMIAILMAFGAASVGVQSPVEVQEVEAGAEWCGPYNVCKTWTEEVYSGWQCDHAAYEYYVDHWIRTYWQYWGGSGWITDHIHYTHNGLYGHKHYTGYYCQ